MGRRVSNENVFQWWDYLTYALLSLLLYGATLHFLWHWFSLADWRRTPLVFGILTFTLLLTISKYQMSWLSLPLMRRPRPMPARPGWKVGVATTFVPGAEPLEMVEETVLAAILGYRGWHSIFQTEQGGAQPLLTHPVHYRWKRFFHLGQLARPDKPEGAICITTFGDLLS